MNESDQKEDKQPDAPVNENTGILVQPFLIIKDPETEEVLIQQRG